MNTTIIEEEQPKDEIDLLTVIFLLAIITVAFTITFAIMAQAVHWIWNWKEFNKGSWYDINSTSNFKWLTFGSSMLIGFYSTVIYFAICGLVLYIGNEEYFWVFYIWEMIGSFLPDWNPLNK